VSGTSSPLMVSTGGAAGASAQDAGTDSARASSLTPDGGNACRELPDKMGFCRGARPIQVGCTPGTPRPTGCLSSPESYSYPGGLNADGQATWCCPEGSSFGGAQASMQAPASPAAACACGEGGKCTCNGPLYLHDGTAKVLTAPKIFVDWWEWWRTPDDPEIASWEDFLQNLGGSKWLETVTQYGGANGLAGNPADLFVPGSAREWRDNTNPLPASTHSCSLDTDCASYGNEGCDGSTHTCYCASDSDCASGHCSKTGTGLCYPTTDQLHAEAEAAATQLTLPDGGMVVIALPPAVPFPGFMAHGDARTSPDVPFVQAGYFPAGTWLLEHEIAETITDPGDGGKFAFYDACGCEIGDLCNPPPSWSEIPQDTLVGESPTENHEVESLWSNYANGGVGECVNATADRTDYFFTACGGHLRHFDYWSQSPTDDFGHLSGVLLNTLNLKTRGPGAAASSDGTLHAFAVDNNGDVDHMWREVGDSPQWDSWGVPTVNGVTYTPVYSPDAFSPRPKTIQVVVPGQSGSTVHVLHKYSVSGSVSGWLDWGTPSGVTIGSRAAAVSWNYNRIDVFVTSGVGGDVYHGYANSSDPGASITWDRDWGHPPSGAIGPYIDAASWGDNEVEVFVQTSFGDVWRKQYDGYANSYTDWVNDDSPAHLSTSFGIGAWGGGSGVSGDTGVGSDGKLYENFHNWPFGTGWIWMSPDVDVCSNADPAAW
jgi:hypothetical protein